MLTHFTCLECGALHGNCLDLTTTIGYGYTDPSRQNVYCPMCVALRISEEAFETLYNELLASRLRGMVNYCPMDREFDPAGRVFELPLLNDAWSPKSFFDARTYPTLYYWDTVSWGWVKFETQPDAPARGGNPTIPNRPRPTGRGEILLTPDQIKCSCNHCERLVIRVALVPPPPPLQAATTPPVDFEALEQAYRMMNAVPRTGRT